MKNNKKLLLFHVTEAKAALIQSICSGMDIRLVKLYKPQYGETIGALAGIPGFAMTYKTYNGEDFEQEMMVLCGFSSDALDEFLKAYRDAGIEPIWLKATVTPHNMAWSAAQLYHELAQEHKQLHG